MKLIDGKLWILDQTKLPVTEQWLEATSPEVMSELIHRLAVRGAPLIGVAAALSLGLYAVTAPSPLAIAEKAHLLARARPTAVNLKYCVDRCLEAFEKNGMDPQAILTEALHIFDEDVRLCEAIAKNGLPFISDGDGVLTHCNAGGLATAGIGTAVGIIISAWKFGKKFHVYVDETRPLLQGARLTTWELKKNGIPHTLICDSMAAALMNKGSVQKIFTGADRIARNGDSANKIGTYSLAVNAHYHRIPFYIAAPRSTYDPKCATGAKIPIEERAESEVAASSGDSLIPSWNPAFDVTPAALISKIIFDDGVFDPAVTKDLGPRSELS